MFTACADTATDYRLGRAPATHYYMTPDFRAHLTVVSSGFTTHPHSPSLLVLCVQHFYPFGWDPNSSKWFDQALEVLVISFLPPPVQPQSKVSEDVP